ncbi:CBF-domain-containing protein [Eremomyces bilateralis CBS 781.70]|uniref:CBF-domain-containing protein n=1 Tax=Eremomyces bilateralis CBS 781.70 TaxID=1392243 RepID=A0A6G1G7U2_9PEZI|nr:CBF-domain-containing protein [Eremomyces bilateralis CBS 781.70]KAF1814006.1 CBF-domain-containing protein [Eremomyces bilateralis CBS 781.70]
MAKSTMKRKRETDPNTRDGSSDSKAAKRLQEQDRIDQLAQGIIESRENYNDLIELLAAAERSEQGKGGLQRHAVASLFGVFSHLIESGNFKKSKGTPQKEVVIVEWLRERLVEFTEALLQQLPGNENSYLPVLIGLARVETQHASPEALWQDGIFARTVRKLSLSGEDFANARTVFVGDYIKGYRDSPFHLFKVARKLLKQRRGDTEADLLRSNLLHTLIDTEPVPQILESENFLFAQDGKRARLAGSEQELKREGQELWLDLFKTGLSKPQQKLVLSKTAELVAPCFSKPELLLDFLTDSYNTGGSVSLLALSGVYYLIQERNLEYPSFFQKLYSLLDDDLLHSKHRSRFFRLLETFLSSTHLPSALLASFMKKLSRLALHGPPGGVVIVIPLVYNLLRKNPSTTFMIHRETRDPEAREEIENEGMDDPFDDAETDPLDTRAIDSCLWELDALTTHYHPNVATVAKIIAQEFRKEAYSLEDFLDYSYASIIESELSKEMKNVPVVEYEIPKRIFTGEGVGELNNLGQLMNSILAQ